MTHPGYANTAIGNSFGIIGRSRMGINDMTASTGWEG
jgi:hypothetical protein